MYNIRSLRFLSGSNNISLIRKISSDPMLGVGCSRDTPAITDESSMSLTL